MSSMIKCRGYIHRLIDQKDQVWDRKDQTE